MHHFIFPHNHKATIAQIGRVKKVRLPIEDNDAGGRAADQRGILVLEEGVVARAQNLERRLVVAAPRPLAQALLDDALARAHQIRRELGRVDANVAPAAHAVRHAEHVRAAAAVTGDEPGVVADCASLPIQVLQRVA